VQLGLRRIERDHHVPALGAEEVLREVGGVAVLLGDQDQWTAADEAGGGLGRNVALAQLIGEQPVRVGGADA